MRLLFAAMILTFASLPASGLEEIPPIELQALDRAITRELNNSHLGSQTLGDLQRLKHRLLRMQQEAKAAPARPAGEAENAGDDSMQSVLRRLEEEAAHPDARAAKRSLALYYVFLNEPEKALAQWRAMGKATDFDLSHLLLSAYLELSLGEYNTGRRNLETALRLMDSRASLLVSPPVFCDTIAGYRVYIPRPQTDVLPGDEVLLYVEVDGATFQPVRDGGSAAGIVFGLKLKDDGQRTQWAESDYGKYEPVFAGPIRDLHAALTWRIPNNLEPGRYHLYVEATDEDTKRRGENLISFNVKKRETNPERRPTGFDPNNPQSYSGIGMNSAYEKQLRDAERTFGGQGLGDSRGSESTPGFNREQFEIRKQNERLQGGVGAW